MITPNPQLLNNKFFILHDLPNRRILTGKIIGPIAHEWASHYLVEAYPAEPVDLFGMPVIGNQTVLTLDHLLSSQLYDDEVLWQEECRTMRTRLEQIRKLAEEQAKGKVGRSRSGSGGKQKVELVDARELMELLDERRDDDDPV